MGLGVSHSELRVRTSISLVWEGAGAGSTGVRVHIYQFFPSKQPHLGAHGCNRGLLQYRVCPHSQPHSPLCLSPAWESTLSIALLELRKRSLLSSSVHMATIAGFLQPYGGQCFLLGFMGCLLQPAPAPTPQWQSGQMALP